MSDSMTGLLNEDKTIIYQDAKGRANEAASDFFFELANAEEVAYRSSNLKLPKSLSHILVRQNPTVESCTGGIVWETSFLLATFLETTGLPPRKSRILEVGAGCGMLGLVLASHGLRVTLTETTAAMDVLRGNVTHAHNIAVAKAAGGTARARLLRWDVLEDRAEALVEDGRDADDGKYDVVVGTDVFFDKLLVSPLLETIRAACHKDTVVWFCFQERCTNAHAHLLRLLPSYFETIENASDRLQKTQGCAAAAELECWLLRLSGVKQIVQEDQLSENQLSKKRQRANSDKTYSCSTITSDSVELSSSSRDDSAGQKLSSSPPLAASHTGAQPPEQSWMSAAFSRAFARAEPDVDLPGHFEDEDFDGKGVAELASRWLAQQQNQEFDSGAPQEERDREDSLQLYNAVQEQHQRSGVGDNSAAEDDSPPSMKRNGNCEPDENENSEQKQKKKKRRKKKDASARETAA